MSDERARLPERRLARTGRLATVSVLAALLSGCAASRGRPEYVASAYGGKAHTFDSDIRLRQPGGTDLTVHDVSFRDRSFDWPIFYGFRVTRWDDRGSCGGWALDLCHPKAIARTGEVKTITGEKDGAPVASPAPMSSQIQRWQASFGHNMLTLNYLRRWFPCGVRDDSLLGRMSLYAGAGAGVAIPYPIVEIDGERTDGFRVAGPALQALAGVQYDLVGPLSLFTEARLQWAYLDIELDGGGSTTTDLWTTSIVAGLSVRF